MRRAKPVWVVSASLDAATAYPVAVLRGEDNPAFFLVEFQEWLNGLEIEAKRRTAPTPRRTLGPRRQAYVQKELLAAGLDTRLVNCDSMKVFVAWLMKFKGYKLVRHELVAIKPM